jgi:hypothetical protein
MSTEIEQGKAIEVATMLGDSVVDVKHCMDPRSGKVSSKTWALLATGALCVLASGIAFYVSVSTAAYNASALDFWTNVANKPAYSYRPELLSSGYDWLAFGGVVFGLVSIAAALLRVRDERRSPYYRVGTAPGVEQPVAGAPTEDFPLVAPSGDDFVFNFARGITGEAIIDGRATPLSELAASGRARPSTALPGAFELPLVDSARIRAAIGQTSFLVSAVARPRRHATPLFAATDSKTMGYFAGSLAVHLGVVLLLSHIPVDAGAGSLDIATAEMTYIRTANNMADEVPPDHDQTHDTGGDGTEGTSAQMALEEGAAGTTATTRKDGHMRIKQKTDDPQLARIQAIEAARTAGVLGVIGTQHGDVFASLTEAGNLSSGFDLDDVRGPLFGAEGEGQGYFGYGRIGFGAGGGCTGNGCEGIIGTEPGYGRIGLGKFGRSGWGGPGIGGGPGQRKHVAGVPNPIIGQPTGTGDLDKSIIRRYIKRNIHKIKYCYEKQLLAKPGLAGSVRVSFFITPTGVVKGSTGAGFDATVANCVAEVVAAIEFPKPSRGGVQVNYPFTFQASGAGNG